MKPEFPTALAYETSLAAAAWQVFADRSVRATLPRVLVETPVPPAFARTHWKGNGLPGFSPACSIFFLQIVVSRWLLVVSCSRRLQANDRRPTTNDRRPTTDDLVASRQIRPRHHRPADLCHGSLQLQVCVLQNWERRRALWRPAVFRLSADGACAGGFGDHKS